MSLILSTVDLFCFCLVSLFQVTFKASVFRKQKALYPGPVKEKQQQKPKQQRLTGSGSGPGKERELYRN